ncbi:DUF3302 domain-containing protein [Roseibium marinum]|uniref:Uncharacterized protein DUF3302 n=1 Tax=Roseibium marinum TaxID=281252 RepID=A0A2S3US86_9HYPH|nr:DUF3302 domain-containing protein [Roseibium marinum]POF30585.1 uncharacterized protein DUF3302 [Roseibium marinum]
MLLTILQIDNVVIKSAGGGMNLIDFELDTYDYLTFLILVLIIVAFFYAMITVGGLPGKLAEKRNHPHAESVKLGGWIGLFTVFPWIHALIWAYHDSLTVDIRKHPSDGEPLREGDNPQAADSGPGPATPVQASPVQAPSGEASNAPSGDGAGA